MHALYTTLDVIMHAAVLLHLLVSLPSVAAPPGAICAVTRFCKCQHALRPHTQNNSYRVLITSLSAYIGWSRGVVQASGLLGDDFPDADAAACSWAGPDPDPAPTQQPSREELQRELDAACAEAEGWRVLHTQLHAFCVDQLLPAPS